MEYLIEVVASETVSLTHGIVVQADSKEEAKKLACAGMGDVKYTKNEECISSKYLYETAEVIEKVK